MLDLLPERLLSESKHIYELWFLDLIFLDLLLVLLLVLLLALPLALTLALNLALTLTSVFVTLSLHHLEYFLLHLDLLLLLQYLYNLILHLVVSQPLTDRLLLGLHIHIFNPIFILHSVHCSLGKELGHFIFDGLHLFPSLVSPPLFLL